MCTIIRPPSLYRGENQYGDFDAAQYLRGQCGDLETFWTGHRAGGEAAGGPKRPGTLELSGRYAIVSVRDADFIGFETETFLVEKTTNG